MFSSKFEELKETVAEKTEQLSDKIEQIKDNFDDDAETTPVVEQQPEVQAEKSTLESIKDMFSSKFEELKETVAEKTEQLSDKIDELRHKADEQDNAVKTTESTHSELSVTREGVVLSEMMAKVYVRQGQYNKAIQIYEQLSLEYPEKSAYFAAKIQSLQK
jgi:chromosome segregation ATPase